MVKKMLTSGGPTLKKNTIYGTIVCIYMDNYHGAQGAFLILNWIKIEA